MAVSISAANVNDYGALLPLLDEALAAGLAGAGQVLADRGYDAKRVREGIEARGFEARIPQRNRPGGGRRRDALARERSLIERTFAWLSWMRRLATRWERRAALYHAFLLLGSALICLRELDRAQS